MKARTRNKIDERARKTLARRPVKAKEELSLVIEPSSDVAAIEKKGMKHFGSVRASFLVSMMLGIGLGVPSLPEKKERKGWK